MSRQIRTEAIKGFLAINAMLREELAAVRGALARRATERKYNPNWPSQPRAPRGTTEGGQWVRVGGGAKQAAPRERPARERTRPGRLPAPTSRESNGRVRLPLSLLMRGNPLALALPLAGDTPQPVRSARIVPGTDDLVLVVIHHRQTGHRYASFERIVRPEREAPLVVFGVDTGLRTIERAQSEQLHVDVAVDGDDVLFDPRELAREYGREVPGVTDSSDRGPPQLTPGFGIVTETVEEAELAERMRAAGRTPAQIQAALDTIRLNRAAGANSEALRREPGVAHNSRPLPVGDENWLRGTDGNAGRIPERVAARLRGRTFRNARDFRRALWLAFAEEPALAAQFPMPDSQDLMANGRAPRAPVSQQLRGQETYIVHHDVRVADDPRRQFDMSSMLIVTPRFHLDIIARAAHFGPRRPPERKAAMNREELIRIAQRILDINRTFKQTDLDNEAAFALEDEERALFVMLKDALPHARITERFSCNPSARAEDLIDEELRYERAFSERGYHPVALRNRDEVVSYLRDVRCIAPSFVDPGRPYRNIDTEFRALSEGILRLQAEFGEEKCQRLIALLESARAHFEADRRGVTKHYAAGRRLLIEVDDILMGKIE